MIKLLANKYVLGAAGLALVAAAVWGYGQYQYIQGVTDTNTAAKLAAFDQYRGEVAKINAASYDLQNRLTDLQNAKPNVITEYKRIVVKTPLPDTCRIDDDRLRGIQSAVSEAAAAR